MGFETRSYLVCDRCGASVEVANGFDPGLSVECPDGWARADGGRFLCPACYPGYDLMKARHKVEVEAFMSERGPASGFR